MFEIEVETKNGIQQETVYELCDFPYKKYLDTQTVRKKSCDYLNISAAFDIETTTIRKIDRQKKKSDKGYYGEGFMYHWQFCLKDTVIFGRTWQQFTEFFSALSNYLQLSSKRILVVYVHNLAFEYQFMKHFIPLKSIFSKEKRKPMKVLTDWGIEFRCSYYLSNMNLQKFCENSELCIHYKLSGDQYDYTLIRTPETEMKETELGYCYNDVRGLCECIDSLLLEDNIATIPLTNTGYVRRDFRRAMSNRRDRQLFLEKKLTLEQYKLCKKAFRGADTHANRLHSGLIMHDVYSDDIQSSYPAVMMTEYFPMSNFISIDFKTQEEFEYYIDKFCVVMTVQLFDVELKNSQPDPYIDIAHCSRFSKIVNDNGRVLKADFIEISITEIDYKIIRDCYHIHGGFIVTKAMYAKRGKLPYTFRKRLLYWYTKKTELKGIEGHEYEYGKSKNRVNSAYGMMVTDIIHKEIEMLGVDYAGYKKYTIEEEQKLLEKYYQSENSFLSYQDGIYVTAHARNRLHLGLKICGMDSIYWDTDSIYYLNKDHKKELSKLSDKIKSIYSDLPLYAEKDGIRYYLGIWDDNGEFSEFKTLGAKKYCYIKKKDNSFHVTVSGLAKSKGAKHYKKPENFVIGSVVKDSGRTTSWYHDKEPYTITVKDYKGKKSTFLTSSNIGVLNSTYTLGISDEYFEIIGKNLMEIEQLSIDL